MKSTPRNDITILRKFSERCNARLTETNGLISSLATGLRSAETENESLLLEISGLNSEIKLLDREIDMLDAHNKSIQEQITLFDEVVRPQLLNELNQSQELVNGKEREYRDKILHFEKLWETYRVAYNKFPRVAERNDLLNKLKLLQIQEMIKKQEMVEKCKQADQLQEIKARRLQILQKEYFEWFSKKQMARLKCEEVENKIMEIKARLAAKKAKKVEEQQRLDEEQRKQQEDERQQQASQEVSNAESASNETGMIQTSSPSLTIKIPTYFNMPNFDDTDMMTADTLPNPIAFTALTERPFLCETSPASIGLDMTHRQSLCNRPLSQPTTSLTSTLGLCNTSLSQPATSQTSTPLNSSASKSAESSPQRCTGSLQLLERGCQLGEIQEADSMRNKNLSEFGTACSEPKKNENLKGLKEVVSMIKSPSIESPHPSSGRSKREWILSTDNIAAKLKETMRPNVVTSDGDGARRKSPKGNCTEVPIIENDINSGDEDLFTQEFIEASDNIELMETDPCGGNVIVSQSHKEYDKDEVQEKAPETANAILGSIDISQSPPQVADSSAHDHLPYDFDGEYNDETYGSLQSPPNFEPVMSPAHAGFDSSPVKSMDDTGSPEADQMAVFSGFNFFSRASTIFGGQSGSEKTANEKDKSASSFSFMF